MLAEKLAFETSAVNRFVAKIRNKKMYQRIPIKQNLLQVTVVLRKLQLFGHICRM